MSDQPPMKQEDHPEHRMPPSMNYMHDNSTIFEYSNSQDQNSGQGPSKYQSEGEGRANYEYAKTERKKNMK